MTPQLAVGGRALWYLTRGAGTVTLILLTLSVVLGVVTTVRWSAPPRWPRFVLDSLHRNVSLLVVAVLTVHVVTAVADSFAPIRLIDAVVPFASPYRPVWVGLGALALDLLLAVAFTSALRHRLGFRAWRGVHWLAYACWPIALVHGFGSGSDTKLGWMLVLSAGCVAAVLAALIWRIAHASPEQPELRRSALALTGAAAIGILVFLLAGPLAGNWARRSGTPSNLLPSATVAQVAARSGGGGGGGGLSVPFTARLSGTVNQGSSADGSEAIVDIDGRLSGATAAVLRIRIIGAPLEGGGVQMSASRVTLGTASQPDAYRGRIVALQDSNFEARVSNGSRALDLRGTLQTDAQSVSGTVSAAAAGASGGEG